MKDWMEPMQKLITSAVMQAGKKQIFSLSLNEFTDKRDSFGFFQSE